MDIKILKKCVKANVPPLTFQEAYGHTTHGANGEQEGVPAARTAPHVCSFSRVCVVQSCLVAS